MSAKKKPTTALTRDAILGAQDLKTKRVDTREWGGHVFVRTMTAGERDAFDMFVTEHRGAPKIRAYIVALCAVDAAGERLFTTEDVDALDGKASTPMTCVFMAARRLNKLFSDDIDDAAKN